jgi:hypothetical protein
MGWLHANQSCYLLNQKSLTFEESKELCETKKASLLNLSDEIEFKVVTSFYSQYLNGHTAWVFNLKLFQ